MDAVVVGSSAPAGAGGATNWVARTATAAVRAIRPAKRRAAKRRAAGSLTGGCTRTAQFGHRRRSAVAVDLRGRRHIGEQSDRRKTTTAERGREGRVVTTEREQRLADVRRRIDDLDRDVVRLLAHRGLLVAEAGRLKADAAAVRAPDRVEQVVTRVRGLATELGADPVVVERTYRAMIGAFIELELGVHRDAAARG